MKASRAAFIRGFVEGFIGTAVATFFVGLVIMALIAQFHPGGLTDWADTSHFTRIRFQIAGAAAVFFAAALIWRRDRAVAAGVIAFKAIDFTAWVVHVMRGYAY